MKNYTLKELQDLYENDEYKALIDEKGLTKHCTGASRESMIEGFVGCGGRELPLYEFPVIKQYTRNAHAYLPDADGVTRRATCRQCLREYNNLIAHKRRSQIFDKQGALNELNKYIRSYLKSEPDANPVYIRVRADSRNNYKFAEVENIKQEAKKISTNYR